jgi:hypothetical protein
MKTAQPRVLCAVLAIAALAASPSSRLAAEPADAPTPADAAPSGPAERRMATDTAWAQVLDDSLPLAQRQRVLASIEEQAQASDQHTLYALGSLYHMGQHARTSPVPQDLVKARLYLGNAAMRGSILAMAKMAEIRLTERQYREAMNWAQIYGHYAALLPRGDRPHDGYTAELIRRIAERLGQSAMPDVMRDVDSFVAGHDAEIRAGAGSQLNGQTLHPTRSKPYIPPAGRLVPQAGFADYLLAFKVDGSVAHAWLLDATPDPDLGARLRRYAEEMQVPAAVPDAQRPWRYAWLPVIYDDGRYQVRSMH